MNRTLVELRVELGAPHRFRIDAEPARKRALVIVDAAWACGCRAAGPDFARLELAPCAAHGRRLAERRPPKRPLPLIGALLARP